MGSAKKKILIGVDGSVHSMNAVQYIGRMLTGSEAEVVLFHTLKEIREDIFDMGIDPISRRRLIALESWDAEQKEAVKKFMEKARQLLLGSGFPDHLVKIKVQPRKIGVARDIAIEAQNDYHAVAIGRRGASKLKDLILGSIAVKLVGKITKIPVCIVGDSPNLEKILVGMDRSECSMRAVEFVGQMVEKRNKTVMVLNVIKGLDIFLQESYDLVFPEYPELIEEAKNGIQPLLEEVKHRLTNAGYQSECVTTRVTQEISGRAGTIVEEAKAGGFGTIVVGRRGLSKVEEFLMGRVSNKVIHMAKEPAVWIIS